MKKQYQNIRPSGTCDYKKCNNTAVRWVKNSGLICCASPFCYSELSKQLKNKKLKISDEIY